MPGKGYTVVEFPDGLQLEQVYFTPFSGVNHKVSKALYEAWEEADKAYVLGLVEWNELNESPLTVETRATLEDIPLGSFPW